MRRAAMKSKPLIPLGSRNALLQESICTDREMRQSGLGYESSQVHEYLAAKARGEKPRRPKAVRWRE
jgi:hypothetical protein